MKTTLIIDHEDGLAPLVYDVDVTTFDINEEYRFSMGGKLVQRKDLPYVPPVPTKHKLRRNSMDTSFVAATAQTPEKSRKLYRLIYPTLISRGGLTDDELRHLFENNNIEVSASGLRTRRKELVEAGWVRPTSVRRISDNGSPATVWEAVERVHHARDES